MREHLPALTGALFVALFLALFSSQSSVSLMPGKGFGDTASSPFGIPSGPTTLVASPSSQGSAVAGTSTDTNLPEAPGTSAGLSRALVNIACDIKRPEGTFLTSGSGVFIDSRGIILTNAHVAQFLLLSTGPVTATCAVRTGNPAVAAYGAELIYISRNWVSTHPGTALSGSPSGTGEDDFALLAVTGTMDGRALPRAFPSVDLVDQVPALGQEVTLGSYGAQNLSAEQVKYSLVQTLTDAAVKDIFAFKETSDASAIDLIALGANSAAQSGSSGGGVMNTEGRIIALIATSRPGINVSAITVGHIRRSFRDDMDIEMDVYLGERPVSELVEAFKGQASSLREALIDSD